MYVGFDQFRCPVQTLKLTLLLKLERDIGLRLATHKSRFVVEGYMILPFSYRGCGY